MRRRRRPALSFLVLALVLLGAYFGGKAGWQAAQPTHLSHPVIVEIAAGGGAQGVATALADSGVLRSPWPFLAWHYLRWPRAKLKAGEYLFEGDLTIANVYAKIAHGDFYYHTLTVPEGYNLFDIAEVVEQSGLASAKDFIAAAHNTASIADIAPHAQTLEGFLFPDTYRFTRQANAQAMVQAMVGRFRQVFSSVAKGVGRQELPPARILEIATLASLVEKETGKPAERPLIAGVFMNRLAIGMPLQCDPTVVYAAILDRAYRGNIYASDLRRASPYNTYVNRGLPPGPVANPGRAALEAAADPAHTAFLYFVADTGGGHIFARTLAEHNRNVQAYRRKMSTRAHG
jgi:UPF0755 protein